MPRHLAPRPPRKLRRRIARLNARIAGYDALLKGKNVYPGQYTKPGSNHK